MGSVILLHSYAGSFYPVFSLPTSILPVLSSVGLYFGPHASHLHATLIMVRSLKGNGQKKWVYPPLFQTKVGGGKMQTSSPPVITPNRSQSNPDVMITLPRPIQSVGMDLHGVSGTSTGQTLPRERRAPPGTHFCPTIWWVYPQSATIFILHPLLPLFHPLLTTRRPSKGGLKRQSLLQTWCGSAPRRGPSANGYDAWRFGSGGPGRKILAAAAADLVWVCAPPRTIRKWLRRLAFWIRRTRAQDP